MILKIYTMDLLHPDVANMVYNMVRGDHIPNIERVFTECINHLLIHSDLTESDVMDIIAKEKSNE